MRNAAVLLALICSTSINAQTLKMNNEAGGQIVLTQEECRYGGESFAPLLRAYGFSSDGTSLRACWKYQDGLIHVIWILNKGTDTSVYKLEDFTYHPKGK